MTTAAAALGAHDWGWTPAGRSTPVLDGVDLSIAPGERVLLLGASGSGKSTLLQAWAGVLGGSDEGDQRGSLTVDDRPVAETRGRVGLLLQDPDAQLVLARARDDVAFGPENLGVPAAQIVERVDSSLRAVGLDLPADAEGARLSGGQRQRLALAGVLALEPAALLLDEPTAQLDPAGVEQVAQAVADLVSERGLTLVVVEHRVDVWAALVDRVIVLDGGRVVADGPVDEVLAAQGAELAARGVWVPGREPEHPPAASSPLGEVLVQTAGLDVQPAGGESISLGLDLEVRAGEVVALTGPNGSGKSTLLLTLAGLLPPAAGSIAALEAGAPGDWSSSDLAARFGVVFQNPEHQFVAGTVRDELAVGPRALARARGDRARGLSAPRAGSLDDSPLRADVAAGRADALLDRLGLRRLAGVSPFSLSGGEQRRLSVATALATAPPVLLLDEPTFGQDSRTWAELATLLAEHRDAGGAVVMATHDRALVEALGAREVALAARAPQPAVSQPPGESQPARRVAGDTPREPGELRGEATAGEATAGGATGGEATAGGDGAGSSGASARRGQTRLGERLNPVASIAASLVPALLLVSTIDVVSAAVALGLQLMLIPFLGIPARLLLRRIAPILIAAPFAALTIVFYGQPSGTVYAEFWLVSISDGSLELALATLLRILAIAIPAIALFSRPDATRLGDALGQNLRLPSRFVLGGVAALRLLTVLRDDARLLERARRARGLGDRGRVRRAAGLVFALLVLSIRRGSALAIGMEARGFGAPGPRTWIRPSPWRASDTAVVAIAVLVSVAAVTTAVLVGTFNPVIGVVGG
ncbi:ATP-binding cassette domain-containing protein [Microcella sp.]|uniref:ATP-binding cassette domain-containing protein n=1 Tax=Microcella sp. TaxID=1913979 RepID=UPI0025F4F072|nr:ATP-binding cassette domain-containing protein [Microcella sp.]